MSGVTPKDLDISKDDQQNINKFSRMNMAQKQRAAQIKQKKDMMEQYDDAKTELEMADEDEPVRFKFGDCFFSINPEQALEKTEEHECIEKQELGELCDQQDEQQAEMKKLKTLLYAKFGKSINLEED